MSTSEIALSFAWMYSTLSADSALTGYAPGGVHRSFAPQGTTAPYIIMVYQPSNSSDATVFGGGRAFADLYFEVMAVGPASSGQALVNAATRIDTLLTIATQTVVTGGAILASFRAQPLQSDVLIDGEVSMNIGGVYHIMAKSN